MSGLAGQLAIMHETLGSLALAAGDAAHAQPRFGTGVGAKFDVPRLFGLIPFIPLLACALCGLCAAMKVKTKLPAAITVGCLLASFGLTIGLYAQVHANPGDFAIIHAFEWINFQWGQSEAQSLTANFSFYADSLTALWMLFVTGLATLIALYASEYMSHDVGQGYCRFFMAFSLFVFSMACLVMGDNLALLFLGWEGVGLCSYLLIGYFYKKPSAVAAAKKAFVVNRIGDLGLSLGVMLAFVQFGSLEYAEIFRKAEPFLALARDGQWQDIPWTVQLIPILLTIGAFGKSAQLPLYVWLPDAMEGPTPVSALIHAATMVTAGVYLVARMFPLFLVSEHALTIVAWGGALTALLAATIGMAQFDIKRIMAYSTVSQLGYMFCGLGVMGVMGGPAHVFTHAFFKAMLFLACGAVMHGFAGQLDLRKLSGLGKMPGWRIVTVAMFVGCINLAGVPFITAGFYSKDTILGDAFANPAMVPIGWILLITAGLTAYYTFRVFFRVFVGPAYYEPGDELHAHDDHSHDHAHANKDHGHDSHGHGHSAWQPHPPGWAINTVLILLTILSFAAIVTVFKADGWLYRMVTNSSAGAGIAADHHHKFFGFDAHAAMKVVSGIVAIAGIAVAFVLHYSGRTSAATSKADSLVPMLGPIPRWAQNKWYVDEFYHFLFVRPLWLLSVVFAAIDKVLVDGLVNVFGWVPKALAKTARPLQNGVLHDYALRMAGGVALLLLIIVLMVNRGDRTSAAASIPPTDNSIGTLPAAPAAVDPIAVSLDPIRAKAQEAVR
ncbi:MAG: NADH-quinone oxidoreductase subunit L [Phycisphaeraceae bacterium]|nr:NADH-quinone oxidoreductase subunit L [Phycisphaeraceae bacterium]